ncbi:glycosyltransferase family 1 protein [Candidatus Woesearchaeota archaeon]|nr:glycosyltransferase family 1 protein [Candidatus Woesearchaeota archaeon]
MPKKRLPGKENISFHYHVMSTRPPIILAPFSQWAPIQVNEYFCEILKGRRAYFILFLYWTHDTQDMAMSRRDWYVKLKEKYPEHEFIFLCNSPTEYYLFKEFNLPSVFCNHNALLDEKIFTILPGVRKRYDAIYNAQMQRFKRHHLACEVKNLALISFINTLKSQISDSKKYFNETKKLLPKATWLNDPLKKNSKRCFKPEEVNKYLNQAKVGLCLSAQEGAMYASAEYLLCGLPVVSTRSRGGRSVFFDKEYVKIVDGTPNDVSAGVKEMIKRNIPPDYIRKKTLEKMKPHRERFIKLIQMIYDREGIDKDFRKEWKKVFINKMVRYQRVSLIGGLYYLKPTQ